MKNKKLLLIVLGIIAGFLFLKFGGVEILMKGFLFLLKWALILYVCVWGAMVAYKIIGKPLLIVIGIGLIIGLLGLV